MALSRLQIITESLNNLGRKSSTLSPDGTTTLGDRAVGWLNDVIIRRVARGVDPGTNGIAPYGHFFSELNKISQISTVQSQQRYGLPSTLREIYDIRVIDGPNSWKLINVNDRQADRFYPNTGNWPSEHRPRLYVQYGYHIELIPRPNKAYTLEMRWSSWPQSLSSDDSTSDLREKDDLLIAGVTAEGYAAYQEHETDAAEWHAKFQVLLNNGIAADVQDWDWAPQNLPHMSNTYSLNEPWKDPFMSSNHESIWWT